MESQHCEICNKLYNLGTREPLIMICCGSFICKACIGDFIRPQEEFFICPFDDCKQQNRSDSKIPPCKALKKILEKNQAVNIYCSEHLNVKADFYCKEHQAMICTNCAFQNHVDHNKQFVPLINQEFETFCSQIKDKLKIEKQKIVSMIENYTLFLDKDRIFLSEEFIKLVKISQDAIAKQDFNKEEQKILGLLGDKIFEEVKVDNQPKIDNQPRINNNPMIDNQPKIVYQPQMHYPPKIDNQPLIDSQLIRPEDIPLITGWMNNPQKVSFSLIFRGTTHGFTAAAFHKQCDNQGPTITIIKSEYERVFGGFCDISWQSNDQYQRDEKAFIFSITQQTKHLQYQNKDAAVYHGKRCLAAFGEVKDIFIGDNCNQNQNCSSNFGFTYKPPVGIKQGTVQTSQYLAGANKFKVFEIETFKVTMN